MTSIDHTIAQSEYSETEEAKINEVLELLRGLPYQSRIKILSWCYNDLEGQAHLLDGSGEYACDNYKHMVDHGCHPDDDR